MMTISEAKALYRTKCCPHCGEKIGLEAALAMVVHESRYYVNFRPREANVTGWIPVSNFCPATMELVSHKD